MHWGHPDRDKLSVFLGDFVLITVLAIAGWYVRAADAGLIEHRQLSLFLIVPAFLASIYVFDLYSLNNLNGLATFIKTVFAISSASIFCYLVFHLLQWRNPVYTSLKVCAVALPVATYAWRRLYFHSSRRLRVPENLLLIGNIRDAEILGLTIENSGSRYNMVGMLTTDASRPALPGRLADAVPMMKVAAAVAGARASSSQSTDAPELRLFGTAVAVGEPESGPQSGISFPNLGAATPDSLLQVISAHRVQGIVIRTDTITLELASVLTQLRFSGVSIYSLLDFCMRISEELPLEFLNEFWFCVADGFELLQARFFRRLKRLEDVFLASVGLLISLPLMLLAAIAIRFDSPGPILFRQIRVGWMGHPFEVLKFRTMRIEAEKDGQPQWASVDDPRITRVGKFLRETHLDELPQLINILRGQMSFVGPRPERPEFVGLLNESISFYELRHYVLPGVTGWAQINYPYGASIEDAKRKLQYDLYYVCNASPLLDFRTMLRTARVMLFRQGSR